MCGEVAFVPREDYLRHLLLAARRVMTKRDLTFRELWLLYEAGNNRSSPPLSFNGSKDIDRALYVLAALAVEHGLADLTHEQATGLERKIDRKQYDY